MYRRTAVVLTRHVPTCRVPDSHGVTRSWCAALAAQGAAEPPLVLGGAMDEKDSRIESAWVGFEG